MVIFHSFVSWPEGILLNIYIYIVSMFSSCSHHVHIDAGFLVSFFYSLAKNSLKFWCFNHLNPPNCFHAFYWFPAKSPVFCGLLFLGVSIHGGTLNQPFYFRMFPFFYRPAVGVPPFMETHQVMSLLLLQSRSSSATLRLGSPSTLDLEIWWDVHGDRVVS